MREQKRESEHTPDARSPISTAADPDESGVIKIAAVESIYIGDMGPPWARAKPKSDRVVDTLLRGIAVHDATHARIADGKLRYRTLDGWRSAAKLPVGIAVKLHARLEQMRHLGTPSCVDDVCHTIEYRAGGKLWRFRMFVSQDGTTIIAPIDNTAEVQIFNAEIRRRRRRALDLGTKALSNGAVAVAREHLEQAHALWTGYCNASEQVRILLALARCDEHDGDLLAAERRYKSAVVVVGDAFGRVDLQLIRIYRALSACAEKRGDQAVASMWATRMRCVWDLFNVS